MSNLAAFPTHTRVHVALSTSNLRESIAFYRALFSQEPTKQRNGYAKFEVLEPAVNLTLNETEDASAPGDPNHFGIQVKSTEEVQAWIGRLETAGLRTRTEDAVACCYAVQDKVWVTDPTGNAWEVFVVLDADVDQYAPDNQNPEPGCCGDAQSKVDAGEPCCGPSCC